MTGVQTCALPICLIGKNQTFDPFANENNFLLGAYIFEDVGVTAYKGAAPLISNKTYLDAAAGILAVEAYHAGAVRTVLYGEAEKNHKIFEIVQKLSDARDSLDGKGDDDQGIKYGSDAGWKPKNPSNLVPADGHGIAYGRTPGHVLNIVYLTPSTNATKGGFYPNGVNGAVNSTSFGNTPAS